MGRYTILLLFASLVVAQEPGVHAPVVGPFGVLHGASYQPAVSPFGCISPAGIAPGSIFILQGAYLGPDELIVGDGPFGLRLPDMPGGTEIHVRSLSTGEVMQAPIVHTWSFQVAAILPRDFPLGEAELQVWHQGQASDPVGFPVVRTYPGLFSASQDGSGRGIIQNYESPSQTPLNGLTHPARPGQYIILWATGLGDAGIEEVEILLEGRSYPVAYAGPAPGIPGVDQINVRLPDDLETRGCYVRLSVAAAGVSSGAVSLALSDDGSPCNHPWGLSPERMSEIESGARATYVRLDLSDGRSTVEDPVAILGNVGSSAFGQAHTLNEAGLESYTEAYRFGRNNIIPASRLSCPSGNGIGAVFGDFYPGPAEPITTAPAPLDLPLRGADGGSPWHLSGPGGRMLELFAPEPTPWWSAVGFVASEVREPGFLAPGDWRLSSPGGSEIVPLETIISMPSLPEITGPEVIRRGEAFELTWRPEDLSPAVQAQVELFFWTPADAEHPEGQRGFGFNCRVDNPTGRILIDMADFLQPLDGVERGELTFRVTAVGPVVQVPGIDRVETQTTAFRTWAVPLE